MDSNPNTSETSSSNLKQDSFSPKITFDEIEDRIAFWSEILPHYESLKYSPYGSSSLIVPDFHRKNIIELAQNATAKDFQYPSIKGEGITGMRATIIDHFPEIRRMKTSGLTITPDNISITCGAVNGISSLIDALCKPDDEVILFEPIYPFHMGKIFLRKNIELRTSRMIFNTESNRFEFDYDNFRKVLSARTRIVIITNPHNPTTRVFTAEEFTKISEILADFPNVVVIEDCAYWLYYATDDIPVRFSTVKAGNFDRTITFYSAGKMFNVTGLRVGIAVGPNKILKEMIRLFPIELHLSPAFEQMVIKLDIVSANELGQNSLDYYQDTRKDINKRVEKLEKEVKKYHINMVKFEGTYYVVLDVSYWRGKVDEKYYKNLNSDDVTKEFDKAFCRMMILERKVGLFPLSCLYFGEDVPDNFVRVTLNRNDEDLEYLFESFEKVLGGRL